VHTEPEKVKTIDCKHVFKVPAVWQVSSCFMSEVSLHMSEALWIEQPDLMSICAFCQALDLVEMLKREYEMLAAIQAINEEVICATSAFTQQWSSVCLW